MIWLIAAELAVLLGLVTALGVAALARIPWRAARWTLWLVVASACLIFSLVFMYEGTRPVGMGFETSWWKYHFTSAGHRPTQRLLVMTSGICLIALPFVFGIIGLWKHRDTGKPAWAGRRSFIPLLLAMVAAAIALVATVAINDRWIQRDLRSYLASAEQQAEKLLTTDLPNDENAYILYRQAALMAAAEPAFPQFPDSQRESDKRQVTDFRLSDTELSAREAFFQSRRLVIELVDQASACATYAAKPSEGILWDHSIELAHWRALIGYLKSEGHLAVVRGNPSKAYANAARLRHLVRHLQSDPRLEILLFSTSIEQVQARLIEHGMQVRPPTLSEAAQLRLAEPNYLQMLANTLDYEEADTKATLARMLLTESRLDFRPYSPKEKSTIIGAVLGRLLYALDDMAAVSLHYDRWRQVAHTSYEIDERLRWPQGTQVDGVATTFYLLPVTWIPDQFIRKGSAYRRMSDAGVAIAAGLPRLSETEIRTKLATFRLAEDPFRTRPLQADVRNGGVVIYSVGRNKIDECGIEEAVPWNHGDECLFLNNEFGTYRRIECQHPDLPWPRLTRD